MARPPPSSNLAELRQCWRLWTNVIERYAAGNGQPQTKDYREYGRLHRCLLKACRSLAEQADPVQRAFYESLEELAKPWLSAPILGRTEGRFLADLLTLSRQAEEQLTGRVRARRWRRALSAAAAFLAASVALVLIVLVLTTVGLPVIGWLQSRASAVYHAAVATTIAQRLVIGGIIVAWSAIVVATRMRRI